MTEIYIKCSNCKCKYHNNDENIKDDFGYNRSGERFKCCVKCRVRGRKTNKTYREKHKEELDEKRREYVKQQFNKTLHEDEQVCTRCYKICLKEDFTGTHDEWVEIDGKKKVIQVANRSCNKCRSRIREWVLYNSNNIKRV